ncbi:hypothetical protein [Pseudoalteromonas phage J2-1_QLiu-2017]|nr:hypothetical protein [Pseudoalteromonas phage J2-1_QLiu-2017]
MTELNYNIATEVKFHKTVQLRNVISGLIHKAQYKGIDDEGNPIMDRTALAPIVSYYGTVKVHGTNASIIVHEDGSVSFHNKTQTLGFIQDDVITQHKDNYAFMLEMRILMPQVYEMIRRVEKLVKDYQQFGEYSDEEIYPIKISGEWFGKGIQNKVGVSKLDKKVFGVFGIKLGESGWLPPVAMFDLTLDYHPSLINLWEHKTFGFSLDPHCVNGTLLGSMSESVGKHCPIAELYGIEPEDWEGEKVLLGEGIVYQPASTELTDNGDWFKVVSEIYKNKSKQKVAKPKVSYTEEQVTNMETFVEHSVTDSRLEQGLEQLGVTKENVTDKDIGKFIGWVCKDIQDEESDLLIKNDLTWKMVASIIASKARHYILKFINDAV